jgi:hypothetical protein
MAAIASRGFVAVLSGLVIIVLGSMNRLATPNLKRKHLRNLIFSLLDYLQPQLPYFSK